MGLEKKTYTFRLCEETHGMLRKIQEALSPFCEDLSSTVRFVIRLAYALLFTPTSLKDVLAICQKLHRITSQDDPQMTFRFPPAIPIQPRFGRLQ